MSYVEISELELKWSIDVIDAYSYIKSSTCYPHLNFLLLQIQSQFMYIMALRIANTNHANTNMAICILKQVDIF